MNRNHLRSVALVLSISLLAASCSSDGDTADTSLPATTSPAPETTDASADLDPYAQTLEWTECDDLECAEAIVPIDYDDPAAGTTTIAMVRQAAQGAPSDRVGTLFINPGGPGGSGIGFLMGNGPSFGQPILDAFDIVGFDPRGVGQSDPLVCTDTAGVDEFIAADIDPEDPESVAAFEAVVVQLGEGCLETNPGLAEHVTTVETAKDLDVLRALVGDEELYYFGASYGTFLGSTYAALFPDKAGRMVLDGALDPQLSDLQNRLAQTGGFQLAFEDYAADCVAKACELGGSVDEIEQVVIDLFDAALAEPIPTDDPDRPLTRTLAFGGVITPLYTEAFWDALTTAIAAAVDGDGSALLLLADEENGRTAEGYESNQTQANYAINCLDAQVAPEADTIPTLDEFVAASSLFGNIVFGLFAGTCDAWPIATSVEFPDYTAPGAAPIVVVGTTGDPATPYEDAQSLAELLESGVLLTREGEGHTAYFASPGNPCIMTIVDAFLAEGTVPDDGTTCSEDGELVDTTSTTTAATTPPTTAEEDGPLGTVTLFVDGDILFEGDIAECTLVQPDVQFLAQGETAQLEAATNADGEVTITVTGGYEFQGIGTASFDPGSTGIDTGKVSISGTGALPDDSAPVQDFIVDADIISC